MRNRGGEQHRVGVTPSRYDVGVDSQVEERSGAEGTGRGAPTLAMLRARRAEIIRVAASRGASNIRVFGSVARGDATPKSDIDLLVSFEPGRSLLDEAGLAAELEELLGYRVDVGSEVHASIRDRVMSQAVSL